MVIIVKLKVTMNAEAWREWADAYGLGDSAAVREDVHRYILDWVQQTPSIQDCGAEVTLQP